MASAIAIIMGLAQLGVVVVILGARGFLYRGPTGGGKG
jgi:putative spermidine/putrescine transport system permease protein